MSCTRVDDRLGEYLEGGLDDTERASLEAHLSGCERCRDALRGLRRTVALLRALPEPTPALDLTASVMERIRADARPPAPRGAFRRIDLPRVAALAAAAACLLLVLDPQVANIPGDAPSLFAQHAGFEKVSGDPAGGTVTQQRRPAAASLPLAGRPSRIAAFANVAPTAGFGDLDGQERSMDRQLQALLLDPAAFLARMGPDAGGERFARLTQHAARQGQAGRMASQLISAPHPLADDLAPRFLAASLQIDSERGARFK